MKRGIDAETHLQHLRIYCLISNQYKVIIFFILYLDTLGLIYGTFELKLKMPFTFWKGAEHSVAM